MLKLTIFATAISLIAAQFLLPGTTTSISVQDPNSQANKKLVWDAVQAVNNDFMNFGQNNYLVPDKILYAWSVNGQPTNTKMYVIYRASACSKATVIATNVNNSTCKPVTTSGTPMLYEIVSAPALFPGSAPQITATKLKDIA